MPYYPDKNHPLKAAPEQNDTEAHELHGAPSVQDRARFSLRFAYDTACKKKAIASKREWAQRVTGRPNATADVADRWLKDPDKMSADEVARTCEAFSCSVDDLRGTFNYVLWGNPTDPERLMYEFNQLNEGAKQTVAAVIDSLFAQQQQLLMAESMEAWYIKEHRRLWQLLQLNGIDPNPQEQEQSR